MFGESLKGIDLAQRQLGEVSSQYSRLEVPDPYKEILNYQLATLDYGVQAHVFARGVVPGIAPRSLVRHTSTVRLASFGS